MGWSLAGRNLSVVNTAGTLNRLVITGSNFGLNQNFTDANQSLAIEARNASTIVNATVTGSTFLGSPGDLANVTGQTGTSMDVIFGVRYFDVGLDIEFDPVNPAYSNVKLDGSKNYTDYMLGVRYIGNFEGKWGYSLRADGSWGGTEGTTNLDGNVTYKTENGAWAFGYRYLTTSLKADNKLANANPDDNLDLDLTLSGPIFSYTWFIK